MYDQHRGGQSGCPLEHVLADLQEGAGDAGADASVVHKRVRVIGCDYRRIMGYSGGVHSAHRQAGGHPTEQSGCDREQRG
jgi:hypothetical protein